MLAAIRQERTDGFEWVGADLASLETVIADYARLRQQVQELQAGNAALRIELDATLSDHMSAEAVREAAEARVAESQQTAELYARNALDAATRSDELKARVAALEAALKQIDALPSELAGDAWAIARKAIVNA